MSKAVTRKRSLGATHKNPRGRDFTDDYFGRSFLTMKVNMRVAHLPKKKKIRVLDLFHGTGRVWDLVGKQSGNAIDVVGVEIRSLRKSPYAVLVGDNRKILPDLDLSGFDVIDLDAFGVPYPQLETIFESDTREGLHHDVFVTFAQNTGGALHNEMLENLGYTYNMLRKVRTLFDRHGIEKFKSYLALRGVGEVWVRESGKSHYLYFRT